jgi:hypothetical protein
MNKKQASRKPTLHRTTVKPLHGDDLTAVAGGKIRTSSDGGCPQDDDTSPVAADVRN